MITILPIPSYDAPGDLEAAVGVALSRPLAELAGASETSRKRPIVVIKPNWIQESAEGTADVWIPVITHPSLILAVIGQLRSKLPGGADIIVCDAPHTYASFQGILQRGAFLEQLKDASIGRIREAGTSIIDLRRETWIRQEGVVTKRVPNTEDPNGYVRIDLGRDSSLFLARGEGRYYGADYDAAQVNEHHRGEVHEYLIAGTPMIADLFINLPKLKTHKKTGITCSLKNLVGINGDKNWLPHHSEGVPSKGGDEFPNSSLGVQVERTLKKLGQRVALAIPTLGTYLYRKMRKAGIGVLGDSQTTIRNGNWHGNDTCWRMALDLNRALLYANREGTWRGAGRRKPYVTIVDGIVAGEGNGPLSPKPVKSGLLIAGTDPAATDAVACRLMGFDPRRIPIVARAFDPHRWPITDLTLDQVTADDRRIGKEVRLDEVAPAVPGGFEPHFGWKDHLRSGQPLVR